MQNNASNNFDNLDIAYVSASLYSGVLFMYYVYV